MTFQDFLKYYKRFADIEVGKMFVYRWDIFQKTEEVKIPIVGTSNCINLTSNTERTAYVTDNTYVIEMCEE